MHFSGVRISPFQKGLQALSERDPGPPLAAVDEIGGYYPLLLGLGPALLDLGFTHPTGHLPHCREQAWAM